MHGAGVSLPVVDEEDMEPLGAEQLYDASECAQLLTHTTTVEKTRRSPTGYQIPLLLLTACALSMDCLCIAWQTRDSMEPNHFC